MKFKTSFSVILAIVLLSSIGHSKTLQSSQISAEKITNSKLQSGWTQLKSDDSQYPIRAFGTPIQIEGYSSVSDENISNAAIDFITQMKTDFNIEPANLRFISFRKFNNLYYVTFRQIYQNIEVLKSEVELRITKQGKVMAYGIKYFNDISINTIPKLNYNDAVSKALNQSNSTKNDDVLQGNSTLFVLPQKIEGKNQYRLVYSTIVENKTEITKVKDFIDANTAEIIESRNLINNADTKFVLKGTVNKKNPKETEEVVFPYMNFTAGSSYSQTDNNGEASINLSNNGNIGGDIDGKYVSVLCSLKTTGYIKGTYTYGNTNSVSLDNGLSLHERNAYHYVNAARNFLLEIDPGINSTISDKKISMTLIYDNETVNAASGGEVIYFLGLNISYNKMLNMPDVLFHEYGHSINKFLYEYYGSYDGMINSSCNEALADIFSAGYLDEHKLCKNYDATENSSYIRDIKNVNIYPDSANGESHHDGLILSGAYWDLREMTDLEYFKKLTHFTKYGLPDDEDLGTAFSEWLIETLIADDNMGEGNNNLSDKTPNFDKIVKAFEMHQIGFGLYISNTFNHAQIKNQESALTNFNVDYSFGYSELSFVKVDSTYLVYSTDNFATTKRIKSSETESPKSYSALIDFVPSGSLVKYYFETYYNGNPKPAYNYSDDYSKSPFQFLVGYKQMKLENFTNTNGWQVGSENDNAYIGIWEVAYCMGNYFSERDYPGFMPATDHTGTGNYFLVTDPNFDYSGFTNGLTTVTSPSYNLTYYVKPYVCLYEWFSFINYGSKNEISLKTEFSYDGGESWTSINKTTRSTFDWKERFYPAYDVSNFKIRFILDAPYVENLTYLVKGFIDDISIWSAGDLDVKESSGNNSIKVYPQPASNYITIEAESESNILIINSFGETVADIQKSGSVYKWNRKDINGNKVPAGLYFCKINQNGTVKTEKIMIVD